MTIKEKHVSSKISFKQDICAQSELYCGHREENRSCFSLASVPALFTYRNKSNKGKRKLTK